MPKKPWWWYRKQKQQAAKAAARQLKGILSPTVAQIFARHPIHDNIFIRLSAASLARMSSVCRDVRVVTIDFMVRAYNLNRRLSHFFRDPLAFRALQSRTLLVISGSFALQFLDRTFYPESDLDLYVRTHDSFREVGLWLQDEGYAYKPSSEEEARTFLEEVEDLDGETWQDYGSNRMTAVYNFERKPLNSASNDTRKVQVILPPLDALDEYESPMKVIMGFHSTCVMNFINHEAAYSLYPYATFEKRCALVFIDNDGSKRALAKYAARGFKMLNRDVNFRKCRSGIYKDPFSSPGFLIDGKRKVADRFTWVLPLVPSHPESPGRSLTGRWSGDLQRHWKVCEKTQGLDCQTRFAVYKCF